MDLKRWQSLALIILVSHITGCHPQVIKEDTVDAGCIRPTPDTFTKAGVDISFAQSTWGKVVSGEFKVKTDPQVVDLASNAAKDARIKGYMRCLSIKRDGYTPQQVAYQDSLAGFIEARPTPAQFLEWQERFPFPTGK